MKHIPILFSTPMVQAVDEDRKSVTRRTRNLDVINEHPDEWKFEGLSMVKAKKECYQVAKFVHISGKVMLVKNPYGVYGDIIWVKETWCEPILFDGAEQDYYYKADNITPADVRSRHMPGKWKPSIFMPREAARFYLSNKGVTIERLKDITEESAIAEGIPVYQGWSPNYLKSENNTCCSTAKGSYQTLWQKLNGSDSWDKNPFVWVINFEKISDQSTLTQTK